MRPSHAMQHDEEARAAPMTVILTLDAALDICSAGVVRDGVAVAQRRQAGGRGSSAALPAMAREVLAEAGVEACALTAIAVTVGPGSFTGVRAALALAHGIGLAAGVPVHGVSVGDAIRAVGAASRPVWVAVDSKRDRVFLDDGVGISTGDVGALPAPAGPVAVAGDAAVRVASRLAARGFDVQLFDARAPGPAGIAAAAARAAMPLYVDPPAARPSAGLRPAPAG
jgi:tRNA threonylcarbamoyladenosine biosynthesis protein TsaB